MYELNEQKNIKRWEMKTEYNFLYTSKGNNDKCYTPDYGIKPLLKYMESFKNKIIWCPFDSESSEFVQIFKKEGFNITYSDIENGHEYDFFNYEPKNWDVIISNPPFTNKRKIFERALSFNKPFALLMTAAWLNDKAPFEVYGTKQMQLLFFKDRMRFKNQGKKRINFKSIYFCYNFLPRDIIVEDF